MKMWTDNNGKLASYEMFGAQIIIDLLASVSLAEVRDVPSHSWLGMCKSLL